MMQSRTENKPKRSHGEGSIRERNGKFLAEVMVNGKRLSHTAATKREAGRWIRETVGKGEQGLLPSDRGKMTVAAYLDRWLATVQPTVKPRAAEHYDWAIRLHLKPPLGSLKLADLRADHLQKLYADELGRGLAVRSVHHLHRVLHNALDDAVVWGLVPRNVADVAKPPKPEKAEQRVWNPDQARAFVSAIAAERLEAAFVLAITCGMRVGEISGLKWEDVDLEAATLQVHRTRQRLRKLAPNGDGPHTFVADGQPKTKKGARLIVLPAPAVAALRRWRARQKEERLFAGEKWQETGYVFTFLKGTPLTPTELYHQFVKIVMRLELPRIRPHDLRHTCATVLLSQNVHPKYVQELLGHSQISVTMDLYSSFLPAMHQEAARTMERVLGAG